MMRRRTIGVVLFAASACQPRPYPVHADLDTSVPHILRVNVSTTEEGTVTLMGTSTEARDGKTSLAINMAQIPPGPQFLRVSFTTKYSERRGSTIVEFNRPVVTPTLKVGSHQYKREALKCGGDACDGDVEAPSNGMLSLPIEAPPGCVVDVAGKSTSMPVQYARFTKDDDYHSFSTTKADRPVLWIEAKVGDKKAPPLPLKAHVTCDDQSVDFDFTLARQ